MSTPVYLSGLRLVGRKVVVVGGGSVAQRRIPALLAAGADVHVVSPQVTPAIEGMYDEITWIPRRFEDHDLDGAWYVVAATDDPEATFEAMRRRQPLGRMVSCEEVADATHLEDLPDRDDCYVWIDARHRGVGSGAVGPDTAAAHRVGPGPYRWSYRVRGE